MCYISGWSYSTDQTTDSDNQQPFNAALNANPIVLIVTLVAGLVVALITLWNTNEDFRNAVTGIWDSIKNVWESVKEAFANFVAAIGEKIEAVKAFFGNLKEDASEKFSAMKEVVSDKFSQIKETMGTTMQAAKDTVSDILGNIKNKFSNIMDSAKNIVSNAINRIKSFFDFSWSLPHLKLPHISISGSFSLTPPSVPHFGIDWYKKAMDDGMIMNQPTIFGYNAKSNQFLAGGEAGSETVVGTQSLMDMIQEAVNNAGSGSGDSEATRALLEAIFNWMRNGGLYKLLIDVLTNGVEFEFDNREIARLVKKHAR